MVVKSAQGAEGVARLKKWAIDPAGGGKVFRWGTSGDFQRCKDFYRGKVPGHMLDGWCANLHRLATGARPGQAPAEKAAAAATGKH
jgi:hypothetical protein